MIDKLSDRLSAAWTILNEHDDKLGVCDVINDAEAVVKAWEDAPVAIMDTRDALGICAPTEDDFPALHALQGKRVKLFVVGDDD